MESLFILRVYVASAWFFPRPWNSTCYFNQLKWPLERSFVYYNPFFHTNLYRFCTYSWILTWKISFAEIVLARWTYNGQLKRKVYSTNHVLNLSWIRWTHTRLNWTVVEVMLWDVVVLVSDIRSSGKRIFPSFMQWWWNGKHFIWIISWYVFISVCQ